MTCDDGTKNTQERKESLSVFCALGRSFFLSFFFFFFFLLVLVRKVVVVVRTDGERERDRDRKRERNNGVTKFNWIGLDWIGFFSNSRYKKERNMRAFHSFSPPSSKTPDFAARPPRAAAVSRHNNKSARRGTVLRERVVVVVSSKKDDDDFDDSANQHCNARKKKKNTLALVASTTACLLCASNAVLSNSAACRAAQVVDWLASGADDASPEELVRIMKESAKEDWDPTTVTSAPDVAKTTTKEEDGGRQSEGESDAASDEVWEKNVNANQLGVGGGVQKSDLSSDGYDIDAPILSSDTGWRLGKLGVILIGADFVTAFIMGKSVLGVAKGLEKGEGEKRDWKETVAEMVMDKLKAKAEVLKEQEEEE